MNTTIITGNIAADAVVRTNEGKDSAINFSVAVNKKWRNQAGEVQQQTTWFECTIWRKPDATSVAQYIKKGGIITVRGEVSARAYADQTGAPQAKLSLRVEDFTFAGSSGQQPQAPAQPQASAPAFQANTPAPQQWATPQPSAPQQWASPQPWASIDPTKDLPF
jgi:single-strand DNA-binding protein